MYYYSIYSEINIFLDGLELIIIEENTSTLTKILCVDFQIQIFTL